MVCKLNAIPAPVMVFDIVSSTAIDVNVGLASTRYTPSTVVSTNLSMTTSPIVSPGGCVNVITVVPLRLGVAELT